MSEGNYGTQKRKTGDRVGRRSFSHRANTERKILEKRSGAVDDPEYAGAEKILLTELWETEKKGSSGSLGKQSRGPQKKT